MASSNTKSFNPILPIILFTLFSIIFLICLFLVLSYFLSATVSGITIFLIILYFIRYLSYSIVFAGGNSIWRRTLEARFCNEFCSSGALKIETIQFFLENLNVREKFVALSRLKSASSFMNQCLSIYSDLALNRDQEKFQSLLSSLHERLLNLFVIDRKSRTISVWYLIENPEKIRRSHRLLDEGLISDSIDLCKIIVKFLKDYSPFTNFNVLYKGEFLLGGIDYQRLDFFSRFYCEQMFLTSEDRKKIDCVLINCDTTPMDTVVVYCCPNGGFYEYIFYQTDWIEFYLQLKTDVFLWNYRGYGRSEGSPSLPDLCRDGEIVVNYLRNVKNSRKIVVHGESLGGAIAAHVANRCRCDLLVADRTFASLFQTIRSYIGFFPALFIEFIGPCDIDNTKNYLEFANYKIITCDPKDLIISDNASLKCGIAKIKQNESRFKLENLSNFEKELKKINELKKKLDIREEKKNQFKTFRHNTVYRTLNTEENELGIESLIIRFLEISDKLDAGGLSFSDLIQKSGPNIENWFSVLEIWGSCPENYTATTYDPRYSARHKLQKAIYSLENLIHEYEDFDNIGVRNTLTHIDACLRALLSIHAWIENQRIHPNNIGRILMIECGHCGTFNSIEKFLFEKLLRESGIFK